MKLIIEGSKEEIAEILRIIKTVPASKQLPTTYPQTEPLPWWYGKYGVTCEAPSEFYTAVQYGMVSCD